MAEPKCQWPELVGKTADEAKEIVQNERPDVQIEVLGKMSPCTMDYREDRVRIVVDDNKVCMAPRTG